MSFHLSSIPIGIHYFEFNMVLARGDIVGDINMLVKGRINDLVLGIGIGLLKYPFLFSFTQGKTVRMYFHYNAGHSSLRMDFSLHMDIGALVGYGFGGMITPFPILKAQYFRAIHAKVLVITATGLQNHSHEDH